MRPFRYAALGLALCFTASAFADVKPGKGCGTFGTSVEFVGSPSEAAKQAKKEQKLILVLHVSGYFEDPALT